jgi:phenylacetate-CoA ligase
MRTYSFAEIFTFAKRQSAYYQKLYQGLPNDPKLQDLPLVDSALFWAANTPENNQVLTATLQDGIVFKSGGTTGSPKFSYFSKEEWETFTFAFGEGMTLGGLCDGERVANLFYAGDLYASFLFIMKSIEASPMKILHLPIGGTAELDHILKTLKDFKVDVWAGVPTSLLKMADAAIKNKVPAPKKILFGGESLYPDQRDQLNALYPGVTIQSIGCASVDGGLVGFADAQCAPQEHRVFSKYTIIEIVNEDTGEVITKPGIVGKIVLTNLTRKLMPIIRYPVGDLGQWVDSESIQDQRKFKILGRSEEGARIGPATIYYDDISKALHIYQKDLMASGFQLLIRHFGNLDQLVVRIASAKTDPSLASRITKTIESDREVLTDLISKKQIHPILIEFITAEELICQPRTGKLKRIIDERF